jgi:hypothetical protein
MNEFWTFIEAQRALIFIPVDLHEDELNHAINSLGPSELAACRTGYAAALDCLDRLEIWEAGSLLVGSPIGDSSYLHFRNWLIWQGRSFAESIASDADHLLHLAEQSDACLSDPFVECLHLLQEPGGSCSTEILPVSSFDEKWNWQDSSAAKIAGDLPKLWAAYGTAFQWELPPSLLSAEEEVPGIGLLRVGDAVRHLFGYGVGTIVSFPVAGTSIGTIDFATEQRTMHISRQFFERPIAK